MMEVKRDFKGVWIPREVWLDKRLSALDKVILTEIDSLDQGDNGCYASNQHLAEFCQCSERKVSDAVTKLIKCGYVSIVSFDGRKRTLRSNLSNVRGRLEKSARQDSKNCEAESQNLLQSNTYRKTSTNTDKVIYVEIIDYLNQKAGTRYRATTSSTRKHIKARIDEGFTVEDFKTVIDKKCSEWLGNSKMEQYLRPETLFGTKFEGYLNAKPQRAQQANTLPAERRETQAEQDKVIELMSQLKA